MARERNRRQGNTVTVPVDSNPTGQNTQSLDLNAEGEADETKAIDFAEKNDDGAGGYSSVAEGVKRKRERKSDEEKGVGTMLEGNLLEKSNGQDENHGENGGVGVSSPVQGGKKKRGRKSKKEKEDMEMKLVGGDLLEKNGVEYVNHGENGGAGDSSVHGEQKKCGRKSKKEKEDMEMEMSEGNLLEKKRGRDVSRGEKDGVGVSSSVREGVREKPDRKTNKEEKDMKGKEMLESDLLEKKDVQDDNHGSNGGVSRRGRKRKVKVGDGEFEMPAFSSGRVIRKPYSLRSPKVKIEVVMPKVSKKDSKVT